MFDNLAKRQLEKEVAKLAREKDASWFNDYQLVLAELKQSFPRQDSNVKALCCVVAHGIAELMALPEMISNELDIAGAVHSVQEHSFDEKTARWAVRCWANALSPLPHAKRAAMAAEIAEVKKQEEADRQAAVAEEERRRAQEEQRRAEERRQRAESEREKGAMKRRQKLVPRWRQAFPEQARGIFDAEVCRRIEAAPDLAALKVEIDEILRVKQEQRRAEKERCLIQDERDKAETERRQKLICSWRQAFPQEARGIPDAEAWGRIETAPDLLAALQAEIDEALRVKKKREQIEAKRAVVAQRERRLLEQAKSERAAAAQKESQRLEQAKKEKNKHLIACWRLTFPTQCAAIKEAAGLQLPLRGSLATSIALDDIGEMLAYLEMSAQRAAQVESLVDAEILRRIETAPDREALENELQKVSQEVERQLKIKKDEERRRLRKKAIEEKQTEIQGYREQFSLQCAGLSDEEILQQLERASTKSAPRDISAASDLSAIEVQAMNERAIALASGGGMTAALSSFQEIAQRFDNVDDL